MAIGITVTRQDHPELVTQLQHEAEDFIAQYGNLFEHPSQIRPGPLQLRTKTLVQRIPKARDRNAASLSYPSAYPQSKRTRVPGCFVCTWEGSNECKRTKISFYRHIVSDVIYSICEEREARTAFPI